LEEYPTRSKPLIVLALLMLSLAATALAQESGNESGTGQMSNSKAEANIPDNEGRDFLGYIDLIVKILAGIAAFLVSLIAIYKFFWKKEKDGGGNRVETAEGSSISFGDSSPSIKADQINIASGEGSKVAGRDYHETKITLTHDALKSLKKSYQPPDPPQFDEIPQRGDLPPGSHVPFSPNRVFTGREEDLLKLARSLFRSDSKGVTITQTAAVATGLGGVGKTQLAIEFCYRYGRFFHGVHWIQADHEITAEIAACGSEMDLSPWPDELEKQTNLTLQAWKESGPRLVIFDNVEDPASVQDWLPRLPKSRLLLTSRSSEWPPGLDIEHHPLGVLPRSESLELLRALAERLKDIPDRELDLVADRLGDLPLALDLAGNYLRSRPTLTPKEYLTELDEAGRSLLEHPAFSDWIKHNPTKHSTSLVYTFALSWSQLTESATDELAGRIFRACGYCAPNTPIPWELLAKTVGAEDTSQRQNLDLALNRLHRLGLITAAEGGSSIMHPLLAVFARIQDRDANASVLPGLAEGLAVLTTAANKTGLPVEVEPLREHLSTVAVAAGVAELDTAGWLWNDLGYHLKNIADYDGAKKSYERALQIDEKVYGPDHPNVAIRVNNLGGVLEDLGDLAGAKNCFERALTIDEKVYGPDHPKVAIRVNNLGVILEDLGDLAGAKESYRRALEIDEKVYGPDHPNVATIVNNLGGVFYSLGDLAGAKKSYERALEIDEKVYGPDHPEVAAGVNNLGGVLQALGDLTGAKESYERALEIDEKAYGPDHPNVAIRANNLGVVLRALGDLTGAKESYERALEIDEKVYGPDHPKVATDINNLGRVFYLLGDLESAQENLERALKIFQHFLGEDHPKTKTVRKNLESLRR